MPERETEGSRIGVEIAGIYSRSENLVKVTRDFDRGRANEDALNDAFASDTAKLYEIEKESGFASLSDGQLRWQDFLRPFSESLYGLESEADLFRWFDTNTFYKKPKVTKKISANDDSFLLEPKYSGARYPGNIRSIAIPGPYTLASLVDNQFYHSKEELVHDFAKALRQTIVKLAASGFSSIQINEPSLVFRYGESALTNPEHLEFFCSAFAENLSKSNARLTVHTYFGDCSKILKRLIALPGVSAIGIDFTQTSLDDLSSIQFDGKNLACGCVDSRSSLVETPEWIAKYCALALKKLSPTGLVIIPSSDLKYLPRAYADQKVRAIGEAAKLVQDIHSN